MRLEPTRTPRLLPAGTPKPHRTAATPVRALSAPVSAETNAPSCATCDASYRLPPKRPVSDRAPYESSPRRNTAYPHPMPPGPGRRYDPVTASAARSRDTPAAAGKRAPRTLRAHQSADELPFPSPDPASLPVFPAQASPIAALPKRTRQRSSSPPTWQPVSHATPYTDLLRGISLAKALSVPCWQ